MSFDIIYKTFLPIFAILTGQTIDWLGFFTALVIVVLIVFLIWYMLRWSLKAERVPNKYFFWSYEKHYSQSVSDRSRSRAFGIRSFPRVCWCCSNSTGNFDPGGQLLVGRFTRELCSDSFHWFATCDRVGCWYPFCFLGYHQSYRFYSEADRHGRKERSLISCGVAGSGLLAGIKNSPFPAHSF